MSELNTSVDSYKIGLVLLAAGESKRMNGAPKQLLQFRGKSLLRRAAETALSSKCEVLCVVLGANFELFINEINDLPLSICKNEVWQLGMSSSIKIGLLKLLEIESSLQAVLIMLCDQPFLKYETLDSLIEIHKRTKKPIVACTYQETIGVPVLFARDFFYNLENLTEDSGAKQLIIANENLVETVKLSESLDVDTQQNYAELLAIDKL